MVGAGRGSQTQDAWLHLAPSAAGGLDALQERSHRRGHAGEFTLFSLGACGVRGRDHQKRDDRGPGPFSKHRWH